MKKTILRIVGLTIIVTLVCIRCNDNNVGSANNSGRVDGFLGVNIEMVPVEGGTFTMGCTTEQGDDCEDDERPPHIVTLSDFSIMKYSVTQGLWMAVMGSNMSLSVGDESSFIVGNEYPVYNVRWNEVQTFIERLNDMTGKTYRLPTEAEWEYAARGGKNSNGYKYPGSNTIEDVAWYWKNSDNQVHPVGTKQSNELGIYDMSGNVSEWVSDRYGNYSSDAQTNPTGPNTDPYYHVIRGGSFVSDTNSSRISHRGWTYPSILSYVTYAIGVRLALSP